MRAASAAGAARAASAARADDRELLRRLGDLARATPRATAMAAVAVDGPREAVALARRAGPGTFRLASPLASPFTFPLTPHSAFEIGSVSKTFAALLLAEMHQRGEVGMHEPLAGHGMTLLHLATHTAGLPRLPANFFPTALPRWWTLPYAAYTTGNLLAAANLGTPAAATHAPGRRLRYSSFGIGLLGHLLERAAGESYPRLLASRVLAPLGLTGTTCVPAPPDQAPPPPGVIPGHRRSPRRPVPPMTCHGLPAAGGIHSTPDDMLRYLRAHLRPAATPLAGALREVARTRLTKPQGGDRLALVWNVRTLPGGLDLYHHSGATRGFTTFTGFCPGADVALAAMANTTASPWDRFVPAAYLLLRELALTAGPSPRPGPARR